MSKKIFTMQLRIDEETEKSISAIAAYNNMSKSYLIRLLIDAVLTIGLHEITALYTKKLIQKGIRP